MANHGVGTKFVSVNLNKSYGQQQAHPPHHHTSSFGSSRVRPSAAHGGGGGGGMVVLSRPRSSQKVGSKLSVPPPLNLPSLRKEHERFDSSGSNGGAVGGGGSGSGSRPNSSGMGWTKPGTIAFQEKDGSGETQVDVTGQNLHSGDRAGKGSSVYMPPLARSGLAGLPGSAPAQASSLVQKVSVLRGEDFPSLKATLSTNNSGPTQKQKDGLNQKQKHVLGDEASNEHKESDRFSSLVHMRPQVQSSIHFVGNGSGENGGEGHGQGSSHATEQARKQGDYFPGPLPLVRLNPRSDWADDERDTSHGITDRGRDYGVQKSEGYWDREFDMPRGSLLPQKSAHNRFNKWGQRDDETGKISSSEVFKVDPYGKDARVPSREGQEGKSWRSSDSYGRDVQTPSREGREGNSWRNSAATKNGVNTQEAANNINGVGARPSSMNQESSRESKFISSSFRDNAQENITGGVSGIREYSFGKRDTGYGQGGRHHWNHTSEPFSSRGVEQNTRDRYSGEQHNRYRGDNLQNNSLSKSSFSSSTKGISMNDSVFNPVREKRSFLKSEKPFVEDPFLKDFGGIGFDGRDPLTGALLGVVKRKKDVLKQTEFHDPVRESFEAELERVQKMQEQERQRVIEEQERALELARREEEERARLAREEEERLRRLEEEAREAAWRAEQERVEAIRRAEEQKIAREEEKQRMLMEEERRKQAAKQKLLELEERISRRQAEAARSGSFSATAADEKMPGTLKERELSRIAEMGDWEDSERMVERITSSASSDSSSLNRSFEMGSRPQSNRDVSAFPERGKPVNSWRRESFENESSSNFLLQDHENGHYSPRRDTSIGGRTFPRKDFHGEPGFTSPRSHYKGGVSEPYLDEFTHLKGQRWGLSGDGYRYSRNTEIDSDENLGEKFVDIGWGQGRSRGNSHSPYPERLYQNPEVDEFYTLGRSRYAMRQPRVPPPPSLTSMHKPSERGGNDRPGPSALLQSEMNYNHLARSESPVHTGYDSGHQEKLEQSELISVQQDSDKTKEQKLNNNTTPRCDSQSSLSVSSPPTSPTHLSHDDLDESGDSPVLSTAAEDSDILLSGNEPALLTSEAGNENMIAASSSISSGDDEEWTVENNERLQEQEEYDEVDDGYQEEDEVHEGYDENINLTHEFEGMQLEEKGSPHMMDNLVLGFNEGVEVEMPRDEFEKSSRNEESTFATPQVSVVEERPFDGLHGGGQIFPPMDSSPRVSIGNSCTPIQEAEKTMHDLVVQPTEASHTSASSDLLHYVPASSSSGPSTQHLVPSSVNTALPSSSDQTGMSNVPAAPSQAELPMKFQFGLFSGPSLIPSPVPAIQIGSIQMPLHLHPQVGPSLSHMHPPQPPLFQFGQFRYTSPISQGILPLNPQSMSFVQPNFPAQFSVTQNPGVPLHVPVSRDMSHNLMKDDDLCLSMEKQPDLVPRHLNLSQDNKLKSVNSLQDGGSAENSLLVHQGQSEFNNVGENNTRSDSHADDGQKPDTVFKSYTSLSNSRELEGQLQTGAASSQSVSRERVISGSKAPGPVSGGRGKKFVFAAKNSGSRLPFMAPEASRMESGGFQRRPRQNIQRTEFRVRENADRRQSSGMLSSNHSGMDRLNFSERGSGISARNGTKRGSVLNRPAKQNLEPESLTSGPFSSQEIDSGSRVEKGAGKEASTKNRNILPSGEGKLKRNMEEDIDSPLQSGIVRVYEQPGIEAPSDEDDFIEVRSKRQMLNDRREQREKEIKAKSRLAKTPRKVRSTSQSIMVASSSNKMSSSLVGEPSNSIPSDFVVSKGRSLANVKVSAGFKTTTVSQPLAPIGTPSVNNEAHADMRSQPIKPLQTSSLPVSGGEKNLGPGLIFETKSKVLDNVQTSLGSWGNRIDQQVMALTQSQLDEAMKPARFDTHAASIGDHTNSANEPSIPSSSTLTKDKQFATAASPVNSLLAGEKIQFGAVTSPTILPPSSRAVSHGIGPPGSCRSDIQIPHNLSAADTDCSLFFEKEKHANESCVHLEDSDAEAAASAVAVAAISTDEIVGNSLGTCSVSVSVTKSFGGADIEGITAGVNGAQQLASQSRGEESLSVALPADLSVETPPITLWPPSQSPHNSSNQVFSHFSAGPPSHFPFYDMNPMLGGPIFAFGPHDESAGTQSQSQKSSPSVSGPLGTWQQCHSGVDSFYGPPAGFTGPFISPPGGIPGVQGPPHMVVYNHFAPVGQFGQVGLSFMGTTYIPGKQPDWKHNPNSSAMGIGEGDMSNMNVVSAQRNPPNMPAPMQHLAPGSPLLPMAPPLAMFDVSPFQSSPDMSVPARWSHVPASSLHSVPMSLPLQQQTESVIHQFSHGSHMDQPLAINSLTASRFPESRSSTPSDSSRNYPVAADVTVTQFPDELGLVDPSKSSVAGASTQMGVPKNSSGGAIADAGKSPLIHNGSTSSSNSSSQGMTSGFRTQSSQQKNMSAQQQSHSTGYNYQRGGISQKNSTGNEWSHRRIGGFQGRNHSLGSEKSFHSSKMKQIYVAKQQPTNGTSSAL